jgi:hypothetical protein
MRWVASSGHDVCDLPRVPGSVSDTIVTMHLVAYRSYLQPCHRKTTAV